MENRFHISCVSCGKNYSLAEGTNHLAVHKGYNPMEIVYPSVNGRLFPNQSARRIERYLPLLPIERLKVSLGEGATPLLQLPTLAKKNRISSLWVKNEGANPTWSFKDRESLLVVTEALRRGTKKLAIASSGNAALSLAAYARRASLSLTCFVPNSISIDKRRLIELYGAQLQLVHGDYEDSYRYLIAHLPTGVINATSGQHLVRDDGGKTISYEIWEEAGVPDLIVCPIGNGSLLAAIWRGFCDLKRLKRITRLPRLIGVQIKHASPIMAAWENGNEEVALSLVPDSIAEGIVARESYCAPKVLRALRESGGRPVVVDDQQIRRALREVLQAESLLPEPTAASVYAALRQLTPAERRGRVVCIQTGSTKNPEEVTELLSSSRVK